MARGGRSGTARIAPSIANTQPDPLAVLLSPTPTVSVFNSSPEPLSLAEDNRLYNPVPQRSSVTINAGIARVVAHKRPMIAYSQPIYARRGLPKGLQVPVGLKFESPLFVVRCLRRKIRREIIFALDKRRKGAGAKRRRRHPDSGVKC